MIHRLTAEAVIAINAGLPCPHAVLDLPGIQSAAAQPFQTFGGVDLYPTLVQKSAVLLHGIVSNHGFFEGNKRTGWLSCAALMTINGLPLRYDEGADDMVVDLAEHKISREDAAEWILDRI